MLRKCTQFVYIVSSSRAVFVVVASLIHRLHCCFFHSIKLSSLKSAQLVYMQTSTASLLHCVHKRIKNFECKRANFKEYMIRPQNMMFRIPEKKNSGKYSQKMCPKHFSKYSAQYKKCVDSGSQNCILASVENTACLN